MKSLVSLIFLFLSMYLFGQDIPNTLKVIQIEDSLSYKTDVTEIDSISFEVIDSLKIIDIKAEHWETTVFNPYKKVEIKFPIKLEFTDSSYTSPIRRNKVVTSRYGWRKGRPHKGIDIDLITGDSILAMFDGIVRFATYNSGHGRTVIVRHYNGLETVYAHLSRYAVKANDTVKQGQVLGKGGTSGNARGSHLHLVINYKGIAINPEYLFNFSEDNTIRAKSIWVTNLWTRPYLHNSRRQSKLEILLTEDEAIASLKAQKRIYVVQRGDTLSKISLKNNVSIAAICKTNYIKRNAIIKVGQKLVIE